MNAGVLGCDDVHCDDNRNECCKYHLIVKHFHLEKPQVFCVLLLRPASCAFESASRLPEPMYVTAVCGEVMRGDNRRSAAHQSPPLFEYVFFFAPCRDMCTGCGKMSSQHYLTTDKRRRLKTRKRVTIEAQESNREWVDKRYSTAKNIV